MNWIKCKDQLPEIGKAVLVLLSRSHVCLGERTGMGSNYEWIVCEDVHENSERYPIYKITHWMPLPEKPTE